MFLGNTFSPMMLAPGVKAKVEEYPIEDIPVSDCTSVVGHEVTAKILSALLRTEIPYNRVSVKLAVGDILFAVIPNFRASEAREFTYEEVKSAGFRSFKIETY